MTCRMVHTVPISAAMSLPRWRRPIALLFMMAAAMPMAFATWAALLNNFVIDVAQFDGADIGCCTAYAKFPDFSLWA